MNQQNLPVEILLVEDNDADLELALHALRQNRLANQIDIARDGEEALDYLFRRGAHAYRAGQTLPKLVLLDLKLPKVNGLEVLQEIKQHTQTASLPVVILTSSREERDMVQSYQLGVNSYIQKPVDFDQFRVTIQQLGMYWLVVNQPPPSTAFS